MRPHTKEFLPEAKAPFGAHIVENTWMPQSSLLEHGWGNGYVIVPFDHPWVLWVMKDNSEFKAESDDQKLNEMAEKYHNSAYDMYKIGVEAHGGITFGHTVEELEDENIKTDGYCIGFDTMHYMDDRDRWPKEKVIEETLNLLKQAIDAYKPGVIAPVLEEYLQD